MTRRSLERAAAPLACAALLLGFGACATSSGASGDPIVDQPLVQEARARDTWCTSTRRLELVGAISDEVAVLADAQRLHVFHSEGENAIVWTTLDLGADTVTHHTMRTPLETARPIAAARRGADIVLALRTADGRRVALIAARPDGTVDDLDILFEAEPGERVRVALAEDGSAAAAMTDGLDIVSVIVTGDRSAAAAQRAFPAVAGPVAFWLDAEWVARTGRVTEGAGGLRAVLWRPVDGQTEDVEVAAPLADDESLLDVSFDASGRVALVVRTEGATRVRVHEASGERVFEEAVPDTTRLLEWEQGRPIVVVPGWTLEDLAVAPDRPRAAFAWPAGHPLATARTSEGALWAITGTADADGRWTLGTDRVRCASP